jgi:aryl-alcohol dehydrogenase-like predicted oxidoreductase
VVSICLGTAQIGMNYGIANQSGILSQTQVNDIIECSVSNNIMTFDTAQSYGNAELKLGNSFKNYDCKTIKVITKLDPSFSHLNKSKVIETIGNSIKRLNVKKIYGFLAHNIDTMCKNFFLDAVLEAQDKKLIEKFGVSVYSPEEALVALSNPEIDLLQIPFNMIDSRWINDGIIDEAKSKNVELFFRSIFLQGFFFLNEDQLVVKNMSWAIPHHRQILKLIKSSGDTIQDTTFSVLSNVSKNANIIVGVDNIMHLRSNLSSFNKMKSTNIDYYKNAWWEQLPNFPERLLNPTLW